MNRLRLAACAVLLCAATCGGFLASGASGSSESEQSFLAGLVSRALSTPTSQVHIGAVDGALSSDATIRDVVLSDRDGPWLKLDRARLKWRRLALLARRLEVDSLEIGHLEVIRKPLPSDKPVKVAGQPLLPELPVKIEIKAFALADLDLGKAVLGTALRAAANGNTELGSPSEGLVFNLDARRLDSPGSFVAALTYVPRSNALAVKLALDEPAGGLVGKLGHVPGEPPVSFNLAGTGTLDAFGAGLDFHAGPSIDAKGTIKLDRKGGGRDLGVRVGGHLGALLPSLAASIFEGESHLASDIRFADDGAVTIDTLALTSRLARLDAHGSLGADQVMDVAASIRAVPNDGEVSHAGAATIRTLVFDADAKGPIKAPRIVAKLALADARLPEGRLERLDASFTATPSGPVSEAATRVALDATIDATGIAPRDAGLAHAIGGAASLALHGSTDTQGDAVFRTIEAKTPTLAVAYAGDLGRDKVLGRVTGSAPDLSRFGDLAGLHLAGRASLGIEVDGSPTEDTMAATIASDIAGFSTGIAAVDRLAGSAVSAKGRITMVDGHYGIERFAVAGAHVSAVADGTASPGAAALTAHVVLPDLAQADPRLTGTGVFDATLTGGLDRPDVSLAAVIDRAGALGRPIPHLALRATVADLRGAAATHVTLDGTIDHKPATGLVDAARHGGGVADEKAGGWDLGALDIAIGSVVLKGSGSIDRDHVASGTLSLAASNLDDLSPLVLTRLGGSMSLDAALTAPGGRQAIKLSGRGADLRAAGAAVRRFGLRLDASDVYGKPILDADVAVDQVLVAGQTLSAIKFSAKGAAARSALTLTARAAGFDLDAAGALVPGAATHLDLARFSARRGGRKIALAGPADLAFDHGGVDIRHLVVDISGGRLEVDGHAGSSLDLDLDARAIPLAAADIAVPGLGLSGTLDASARLGGSAKAPVGPYRIGVRRLVAPQARSAGLPPVDIAASGRLDGHRAGVEARLDAGRAGSLTASGSLPLDIAGPLDLAVHGSLDAALANAKLGVSGRTVTGKLLVDAKLAGTRAAPRVGGGASMTGGTFRDVLLGVRLDAIEARIAARGERIAIERFSATTPNGGTLSASGQVRVDPDAGFPGSIMLRGHQAQLVSSPLVTAVADLSLDVSGALARNPRVGGRVDLIHADVGVPDRMPTALKPIDGITHINLTPQAAARLALADRKARAAAGTKGRAALFDAALDVTISAPNRIFVRGRGIDAELGGNLKVTGTTAKPMPNGGFELRRGKLVALGKTLTFTKGKLAFTGDLVPEVDFAAEIQSSDITAQIAVTGPAAAPVFAFTSTPELPQDEILSRVLFQKASGSLTGFQALQLAEAAAQFSSGGDGAFEQMRKSLGVDSLDIGAGAGGGPSVGISRAISDRVSVGVRTGATAAETGLSADVDVTKHIRVQSDVRSNGATSVGVGTELEY